MSISIKLVIMIKDHVTILKEIVKYLLIGTVIGAIVGVLGAFFLFSLKWAYQTRNTYPYFIWLLPIGGFTVGYVYHQWGKSVVGGNNQIIEEINKPTKHISFLMTPFVLFGTIITHLFGGSAGREGTAVQIGASVADQLTKVFKLTNEDRRILLKAGVAAGFASVFGTPLAGILFAFEVSNIGKVNYRALFACLVSAVLADAFTRFIGAPHTHYHINLVPDLSFVNMSWSVLAGVVFGVGGMAFSLGTKYSGVLFAKIGYPPLRPLVGGLIFALVVFTFGYETTERFHGLGVEHIVRSFEQEVPSYDFIAKITLTSLILGSGFKGGEVTPIFFTGATLGNALSKVIPLPISLLAGMGFVAVFAAAANTPIATILMGIELFGHESMYYVAIACITAYLISGKTSIYKSQTIGIAKSINLKEDENLKIG